MSYPVNIKTELRKMYGPNWWKLDGKLEFKDLKKHVTSNGGDVNNINDVVSAFTEFIKTDAVVEEKQVRTERVSKIRRISSGKSKSPIREISVSVSSSDDEQSEYYSETSKIARGAISPQYYSETSNLIPFAYSKMKNSSRPLEMETLQTENIVDSRSVLEDVVIEMSGLYDEINNLKSELRSYKKSKYPKNEPINQKTDIINPFIGIMIFALMIRFIYIYMDQSYWQSQFELFIESTHQMIRISFQLAKNFGAMLMIFLSSLETVSTSVVSTLIFLQNILYNVFMQIRSVTPDPILLLFKFLTK